MDGYYVGEKRLEKAVGERPDLDVERRWRPFQLRPEMPAGGMPWRSFALEKFGGEENMARALAHVAAAGRPTASSSTSTGSQAPPTPWTRIA